MDATNNTVRKLTCAAMVCSTLLTSNVPAYAGTVMGNGGSTEVTQILNNGELVASVAEQVAMVEEQIRTKILVYQQYVTMLTNLKNLPQNLLNAALAPYMKLITDLKRTYETVKNVRTAIENTRNMLAGRLKEMKSLKMSPQAYLNAESSLAAVKGGIYQQQMNADLKTLDDLQSRSEQLSKLADQIPQVTGNIEGLQLLNQQTNMLTGEMMDLKAQIVKQNALANQDRADLELAKAASNDQASKNNDLEDLRSQRNKDVSGQVQFKPSWTK